MSRQIGSTYARSLIRIDCGSVRPGCGCGIERRPSIDQFFNLDWVEGCPLPPGPRPIQRSLLPVCRSDQYRHLQFERNHSRCCPHMYRRPTKGSVHIVFSTPHASIEWHGKSRVNLWFDARALSGRSILRMLLPLAPLIQCYGGNRSAERVHAIRTLPSKI